MTSTGRLASAALPLIVLCLVMSVGQAAAQRTPPPDSTVPSPATGQPSDAQTEGMHDSLPLMGIWLGATHHSSFSTRRGTQPHDFYILGLRSGWTIARWTNGALDYTIDVIPAAIMTGNRTYTVAPTQCPAGAVCPYKLRTVSTYHTVYGFGLVPIGWQLQLLTQEPVQVLLDATGGVLWFAHPVPDPRATRFNFTAELGGAVRWNYSANHALLIGYKLHHTSNAGTGKVNPGLNSGMFYVGFTKRRD